MNCPICENEPVRGKLIKRDKGGKPVGKTQPGEPIVLVSRELADGVLRVYLCSNPKCGNVYGRIEE